MKKILVSMFLLLASITFALAQTSTGSLTGTVSTTDGVLPGATVTVTSNATGREQTVTTNESGSFTVQQLEAGTYTVRVTGSGFKTFVANEVKIDVGREYSLTPVLEVGAVQETVTVTAGADVVTATTSQVSNTVSPQQILSLPLITRDPLNLTTLQAGVQSNAFQNSTINGMRTSFTNITRDGINIQDNFIRGNATDFAPGRPTVDDTAEFTIITNNQEADQGYGGAQIRLVTPRGTKDFHGALFEYNRNSNFAANDFFANRSGTKRPFRNRNQFGGKIGGPLPLPGFNEGGPVIHRDKGFFFFSYEKIIDPLSVGRTRTILTESARNGAFRYNRAVAGNPIDANGVSCPSGAVGSVCTITNILTFARAANLPFATSDGGNPIPATINPVIQSRIISQLPTVSNFSGGDGLNTAGFFVNRAANNEGLREAGRIDIEPTDKDSISGIFAYNFETNIRNDLDPTGFDPIPRGSQTSGNKTLSLTYRRIVSSNIVNELRGGLFYSSVPFQRDIPNPTDYVLNVPLVSNPENNFQNQGRSVKTYNLQDNVDVIVGKHSFRFGGQIQKFRPTSDNLAGTVPLVSVQTFSGVTPAFTTANFTNVGGISTAQLGTANGLLGLLGGIVAQQSQTFNLEDVSSGFQRVSAIQPFKYENYSLYAADRWQITNDLTLNLGLRYELFPALRLDNGLALEPVISDPDNPIASLLDRNGTYAPIGGNAGRKNAYYKTDNNNFGPNVGFAYAPKFEKGIGKFLLGESVVIRGGYSRIFGNDQTVTAIDGAVGQNVGLASRTGFTFSPTQQSIINGRLGSDSLPPPVTPAFVPPPFTYIRNNTTGISGTSNFGTVFAVDPKLQTPSIDQYSFGIQREFGGNMAFEARYVGTRSGNLVRGYDLNQIDIFNNGFLADFNRASSNLAIVNAERARLLATGLTQAQVNAQQPLTPFCTLAGCVATTILRPTGAGVTAGQGRILVGAAGTGFAGGVPLTTLNANITNGTPADLVTFIIQQGFNNHPNLNNPTATPNINFVANPSTGVVDFLTNDAHYNYNSLQLELRRRFAQGLYFQANYTFSKNLTNAIGTAQSQFEPYLDNNNQDLDYSRADTDQTHTFNFNGVYQLPFGKGKTFLNQGGIVDRIFGGFEISGLLQYGSGAPITFVDNRGTLNRTARSSRQTPFSTMTARQLQSLVGIFERVNAQGENIIYFIDPSIINPATGRASEGFGAAPFAGQALFNVNPGHTGNLGRAIIDGPRNFNVNLALLKNIRITESTRFQIRVEAFNVFNNVSFFNNTQFSNINSATFGQITSTDTPRQIQFAGRFEF
jgi:hypothetical protein